MTEFKFLSNFSNSKLAELSKSRLEPAWLSQRRLEAFNRFQSLNWPSKSEEEWRRTDLNRLSDLEVGLDWSLKGQPQIKTNGFKSNGFAAHLEQIDSPQVRYSADPNLPNTVIFSDLESAIQNYPDLVQKQEDLIQPEESKFSAFNRAFWNKGIFLHLPRNMELAIPLYSHLGLEGQGWGVLPYSLIVLEENSRVILVDDYSSSDQKKEAFSNALTEIHLKANSHLTYVNLQRWGEGVHHFYRQKVKLDANAHLTTLTVNLGASTVRSDIETILAGQGAFSHMFGLAIADKSQYFEQHTRQTHLAPQTTSDLLFKTALFGESTAIFSGLIQVAKPAQRTDAYQANRNLLLSEKAKVDTLPKLEILANDVRCTHGATVGPIDQEQFFYLLSRGIPSKEAQYLIVEGFFEDVLGRISKAEYLEQVRQHLSKKILH
ncbi:MAG: Fe-S cluster assembly protein SufD [candidate division Zixibacteria bacterium RBG_16_50_21]|nr:MAG: Fe-S cluster assembly protein SufD [candidate division Zixibacteria bacterium RBG_16_50_21]